jgi:hypothetical protein
MDWKSYHSRKWIRTIASILVVTFIHQDALWAQGGTPVWSKQANGNFSFKQPISTQGEPIRVPYDVAVTKDSHVAATSPGTKTIINIQDVHASLGAQESIASILDSLVANYDLRLIGIEGSSGYIDTSLLRTFPDAKIKTHTAHDLMRQGKMSAGEFFSITSNKPIAVYGIEDRTLYRDNVEQFRNVYQISAEIKHDIAKLAQALGKLRDAVYSRELKELEENSVLHEDGKIGFGQRWELVNKLAGRVGLDCSKYTNLTELIESLKLEKKIDFKQANI